MPGAIVTAPDATPLPGWYGKIPALGDFASRRLPPEFIAFWDAWLQRQIVAGRALLGERWQAAYLHSPGWRFVLLPGACGATCWAGLLTPSRDKVGRCFPLTIALGLDPQRDTIDGVFAAGDWFDALETIALAARQHDTPPEQFDAALLDTPCPGTRAQVPDGAARALGQWWLGASASCPPLSLSLPEPAGMAPLLAGAALHALVAGATGRTLWWRKGHPGTPAPMLACCGMPADDQARLLLAGAQ